MADDDDVRDANTAFYEAFEKGDLDSMLALWVDDEQSVCIHPGALPVRGASPIGRSWALIMANTPYIQFFLTDVEVSVRGDTAAVTCTENVLTGEASVEAFGGGRAVATNLFRRTPRGWLLWLHHSSPVIAEPGDESL